jgi:methionyl-tRNA formyltransferase
MSRDVVVLGKGEIAIRASRLLHASEEYRLVSVVPVMPEPDWAPSMAQWAAAHDVPCVSSGNYEDLLGGQDASWRVDLGFVFAYMRILPAWFIARFGRIFNLHQSVLPRYRGVGSINWALANGEREHGATLHELTEEIDAGPIVAQVRYSIYPEFDEVRDVYNRGIEYSWTLFQQTLPLLDSIEGVPQDETEATYFGEADRELLGDRRTFTRQESSGIG